MFSPDGTPSNCMGRRSARATRWDRVVPARKSTATPRTLQDFSITKSPFVTIRNCTTRFAYSISGAILVEKVMRSVFNDFCRVANVSRNQNSGYVFRRVETHVRFMGTVGFFGSRPGTQIGRAHV